MSKSGFSTLNRWLGRKNKDKSMANGKLSKSSTNLSISSTNINETSQLEYNRITPLPAATTNAPFEQTFRITVLLPKDQLYVTRLGARVPLSKLLELVCDNKLLDQDKYEFRNPVDPSQVYSCDLTIGAVGLSEIRLCHKSESYDNFNSDEIIKLHRSSLIRESLSSSEFSSRHSKHTTKTTSPYSSTNSLNSMDSSAVSCGRASKLQPKVFAPPRKKRAAPRPPSQTVIPEKSPLIMENGGLEKEKKPVALESSLAVTDFSTSTPNLTSSTMLHSDINGNVDDFNELSSGNGSLNSHGYNEDTVLYAQVQKKNALNLNSQSKSDLHESGTCKEVNVQTLPEPSPRKRIVQIKKKTTAPPAPTPRNSLYQEDDVSIASTNLSGCSAPSTPNISAKSTLDNGEQHKQNPESPKLSNNNNVPTPVPRITTTTSATSSSSSTSTTLLNSTDIEHDLKHITNDSEESKAKSNISKVLLNRTPTPEPRSLSCEPPEIEHCYEAQLEQFTQNGSEEDCVSKQADSGIGEPVPSPLPDSLTSQVSNLDVKSHFESSSDDDDMVKVYNFKLGKTLVKPANETKTLEELAIMNNVQEETDSELSTPLTLAPGPLSSTLSETASWNFAIPISPPPNFADSKFVDTTAADAKPDTPITPKITERPVLNFESMKQEPEERLPVSGNKEIPDEMSTQSPTTPLDSILQELSSIIHDKGVESLMKKPEEPQQIEAATLNTLSNFSINAINQSDSTNSKDVSTESSATNISLSLMDPARAPPPLSSPASSTPEEEKLYRKRSSAATLKQRRSVTRSDSFHSTAAPNENISLNTRTSSQLSLDQMAGHLNRRRSSSELSIGESPSLQSLEVIKTILNSRKNSLPNSNNEEDKTIEVNARRPSEELRFASLELKTPKSLERSERCDNDDAQKEEQTKNFEVNEKPKELPKVYRYSGPPSINFATWNERPKSQVAIKNEGDYIFGGPKSITNIKNFRQSASIAGANEAAPMPPKLAPKPATTVVQRMGIPENNYKVPVLVRPLQDVIIAATSTTQKEGEAKSLPSIQCQPQRPTVESVLRPQTQVIANSGSNPVPRNIQRVSVEAVLRPQTQNIVNTSTLPRVNKQRFSLGTAAAGPQLLRPSSNKQTQESEKSAGNTAVLPGPQILRSSSVKQTEVQKPQAPFGQNTLRRTGFKEKMLAKEEHAQRTDAPPCSSPAAAVLNGGSNVTSQKFYNSIKSAKLHLNLRESNTSVTATPGANCTLETPALKPKLATPKTAPVLITGGNTFSISPPPAPPMSATIQLKPLGQVRTPTAAPTEDPRDELLEAIRSFNKGALKKA